MKKFGLIGYPLGHSVSPFIHKELFKINNIDASYELKEIDPEDFQNVKNEMKDFDGFNVTIPHKINIIPFLNGVSQRAELFGAVNTVKNENGVLTGHNTDCYGFLRALESAGIDLGGRVLVCGSGGVSRMFAFEAVIAGASLTMAVRSSDIEAGKQIKSEIAEKLSKDIRLVNLDDVDDGFDLIVNGTPVGMFPNTDACVLPKEIIQKSKAVFDAVYNPLKTRFTEYAEQAGMKYSNGLPMLVWQAAVAQEIWFDFKFTPEQVSSVIKITEKELKG